MEEMGYKEEYQQGHKTITGKEGVTEVAQLTINILNAYTRYKLNEEDTYIEDLLAINYAGSINITTYLKISNNKLIECVYRPLLEEGVETLHELIGDGEIEQDGNWMRRIRMVINTIPLLLELASSFEEETTVEMGEVSNVLDDNGKWIKSDKISTKELQWILKYAMGKVSSQNFKTKLKHRY